MGTLASNRSRMLAALILSALAACLGLVLRAPSGPVANAWVRSSYDALHSLTPASHGTPMGWPVVIVYLDLPSYGKQDPAQPTRYQGEAVLPLEEHKVDFQEGVTYYAFAEDNNPENPQRATTDLQFIDIRPYKREFQLVDGGGT